MTYEDTARISLETYPEIHPDILAFAHHAFLVTGNGYEWDAETGELVRDIWSSEKLTHIRPKNREEARELTQAEAKFTAELLPPALRRPAPFRAQEEVERLLVQKFTEIPITNLYPANIKFAAICNIPQNIERSWRMAADYFCSYVLTYSKESRFPDAHRACMFGLNLLEQLP